MNTIDLENAHEIIIDAIENKTQHINYKRVNDLAKLYKALITGEGIDELLKQFELREDKEAFDQRVKLTQSTTDALCNSIRNPFEKVLRTDPLIKRIESKDEKAVEIITDKLVEFYNSENQNSGLDYWIQTRFKSLSFLDPNCFVVLEWDSFDSNKERATPYPYEVPCDQAINFEYKNNELQYLLDKREVTFIEDDVKIKGFKYTLYGIGFVIAYERVPEKYIAEGNERIWKDIAGNKYVIRIHETKLDYVPAFVVGYIGDELTKEVTYVNPFHSAISYFKKIVKLISEADLSKTLHAFPQKMQYVQPCMGHNGNACMEGRDRDGNVCGSCNGKGYIFHTSAQDAVIMPLPRRNEEIVDLDKLLVYKYPPIDLLEFQESIIDKYEQKIHVSIFNTLSLVKKTVVATATERDQDMDNVYDTLHPFAEKITTVWSSTVDHIAEIADVYPDDLIIDIRYPNDFKLKTLAHLIEDLKLANESNAPAFMRAKINDDIAEQTFVDQPEEFTKYQVKQRFYPFPGKIIDEIIMLISADLVPIETKVLYANFETIFRKAEKEHAKFWTMTFDKQDKIVQKYIEELVEQITPEPLEFNPGEEA